MLARINAAKNNDKGFTLIELLVVIIIIGILSAVAIPLFLNQQKKAQDAAAKADVSTIGKEVATYFVDSATGPDLQQTATTYTLGGAKIGNRSANVSLTTSGVVAGTNETWCVHVTNAKGDKAASPGYKYSAAGGLQEGTC